nr:Serine/threonine-protein kinase BtrW [Chlamydiota bacterium]
SILYMIASPKESWMGWLLLEAGMTNKAFSAELSELPAMLTWVRSHLDQTSLPKPEKMRLEIAMEEAIINVIHHAKTEEKLHLTVRHMPGRQIEFDLIDSGAPFNPLTHPQAEEDIPLEEQTPGGKGLVLMRKCTDALLYRREGECNILTLVKKIE